MESVEHYYNSRIRLFVNCALLLTWEFFGKQLKPNIDFEYFNLSIATEAIPFLLAMLILFNTYSFSLHFKIINKARNKLSVFDYYIALVVSLFSLITNFFYQIQHSSSKAFLMVTTGQETSVFISVIELISTYYFF